MVMKPVDRWANEGPDFNRQAADAVYGQVMKMHPDEAVMFTRLVADASLQHDLMVHGEMIAKTATEVLNKRAELMKSHLARTAISKARAGQDATPELVAIDAISKSWLGDLFSHAARQQRARKRQRDLSTGQFAVEHHTITTNGSKDEGGAAPTPTDTPEKEAAWAALTPAQRSSYQQAYSQIASLIRPYTKAPAGTSFLHLRDEDGEEKMSPIPHGDNAVLDPNVVHRGGKRITHAKISFVPPETASGGIMSMFNAIGMPRTGAVLGGSTDKGVLNQGSLQQLQTDLTPATNDNEYPSNKVFRRMTASSKLIGDTLGNAAPPQAKMALGLAHHIGTIGPDVRTVVGPTLDRAAYRYRGTERKIDPRLTRAIDADHRTATTHAVTTAKAARGQRDADAARDRGLGLNKMGYDDRINEVRRYVAESETHLRTGRIGRDEHRQRIKVARRTADEAQRRYRDSDRATHATHKQASAEFARMAAQGANEHAQLTASAVARGVGEDNEWAPSETLAYFKRLVPSAELNDLHLTAGNIPASQGIIIDSKGKVTSQAVGYGDDHYLPFPIKAMRSMRGGSYIRTRTWGGPTAEDIRTSLIGGASSLTVVSNNGVFHVDFDEDFKGGRRHNDKAYRMVGRYEHLLDAVKSGNVSRAGIPPSRLDELRAEAGGEDAPGFSSEFARLKRDAIANPKLSKVQREEVAAEYLREHAEGISARGEDATTASMINDIATRRAREQHAELLAEHRAEANVSWRANARAAGDTEAAESGLEPPPSVEALRQAQLDKLRSADPEQALRNVAEAIGKGPGLTAALAHAEVQNRHNMKRLRLNGNGYDLALKALQEQFPYYINSAEFHPWHDASQLDDTGYVRPGATRPGAAQFGLYEADAGAGKYRADTVRGQNGGERLAGISRDGDRSSVATTTTTTTTTPATERTTASSDTQQLAAAQRVTAANRDMLNLLTGMQRFGPNAKLTRNGTDYSFANQSIASARAEPGFPSELAPFLGTGVDANKLRAKLEGDQSAVLTDQMNRAVTWLTDHNAFSTDEITARKVKAFQDAGAPQGSDSTRDLGDILGNPHRDFEFVDADPTLIRGRGVSESDAQRAYGRNGLVRMLVANQALPAMVSDASFDAKATALHQQLAANYDALERYKVNRTGHPPMNEGQLKNAAFGLATALQARRRYDDAASATAARDEAAAAAKQAEFDAQQPARDAMKEALREQMAQSGNMNFAGWRQEHWDAYDADPALKQEVDDNIRAAGGDPQSVVEKAKLKAMIDNMPADPTGATFLGHAILGGQQGIGR